MIIDVDRDSHTAFFFTAGNLPTQKAYGLTLDDVTDTFIVGLLRSQRLLCAASYFFETPTTRVLADRFPKLWRDQSGRAIFFVNEDYASFSDHGAGKLAKSPAIFSPYADAESVMLHGKLLDDIGVMGRRRDVDISAAIAQAWVNSCLSTHQDSLGTMLRKRFPGRAEGVIAACADLSNRTKFDFIWETIEGAVKSHSDLSQVRKDLQRRLADIYATVMSQRLSAIETSPSLNPDRRAVTANSIGNLGLFWDVLRRAGLDLREMRDEDKLLRVLDLDELRVLQQMDELIVEAATQSNFEASKYWGALRIAEGREPAAEATHHQIRQVLSHVMSKHGLKPANALLSQLADLETIFATRLLPAFKKGVEQLHDPSQRKSQVTPGIAEPRARLTLFMCSANPPNISNKLSLEEEYRAIRQAINANRDISVLTLDYLPNLRAEEFQAELAMHSPVFLHLSGHGSETGHFAVLDQFGERYAALHSSTLAESIRLHCPNIQCVYLNACFSETAIINLGKIVPFSVVLSGKISDRLAQIFAAAFYGAIDAGLATQSAFDSAINQAIMRDLDPAPVRLFKGTELIRSGDGKAAPAAIGAVVRFGEDSFR